MKIICGVLSFVHCVWINGNPYVCGKVRRIVVIMRMGPTTGETRELTQRGTKFEEIIHYCVICMYAFIQISNECDNVFDEEMAVEGANAQA